MTRSGGWARWGAAIAGAAALLAAPALAQDQDDAETAEETEESADSDEAQFEDDLTFMRECLETLAARGAHARNCIDIVVRQCASEPDGETNAGAAACEQREADVWRALLEEAETNVSGRMSNAERDSFTSVQDAWAAFRDAQCAFEASRAERDADAEVERTACLRRLTADRTITLHAQER